MEQFLELFSPQPAYSYLLVTTHFDAIGEALAKKLLPFNGTLEVAQYPGAHIQSGAPNIKIRNIESFDKPFRALPRSFDAIVFQDFYHLHTKQERIIQLAYNALANTADMIIMQRRGEMDIEAMLMLLEKSEFRAGNALDILQEYDIVMGKKMHMWGNGL